MMALDTNILIYAHRDEFAEHGQARDLLLQMADGPELWALPVFCLGEFLRVVTHPGILHPPSSLKDASATLGALVESASLRVLMPGDHFPQFFMETVNLGRATGNLVFDAQIVALCREHGVETICSNDRDLERFPGIQIRRL